MANPGLSAINRIEHYDAVANNNLFSGEQKHDEFFSRCAMVRALVEFLRQPESLEIGRSQANFALESARTKLTSSPTPCH
jgi:hypothetical protein